MRHLVDKETAVKDVVRDYFTVAQKVVEGYEKELKEELGAQRAAFVIERASLQQIYQTGLASLARNRKRMITKPMRQSALLEAQMKQQREEEERAMAAAFAMCQ